MCHLDFYAETIIRHQHAATEARIARRQLLREALAGRRGQVTFYQPLMASIGRQMVAWGMRLQRQADQSDQTWATQNQ